MTYVNLHSHRKPSREEISIRNGWLHGPGHAIYPVSCGIHPWYVPENLKASLETLDRLLQDPRVVAVGECGIDMLRGPAIETQGKIFQAQVLLAEKYHKPLIIHMVRTADLIIQWRKQLQPRMPWIIHGFRGKEDLAHRLIRSGMWLSFGTALIRDELLSGVFLQVPSEYIFLETDVSPVPVQELYRYAERLRPGITRQILENAQRLFPDVMDQGRYLH